MNIFGYKDQPITKGFGDVFDPDEGGHWEEFVMKTHMRNHLWYPLVKTGLSRHGHQYGYSKKFRRFLLATLMPLVNVQKTLLDLTDMHVDTANGIKLDLIGRIIGAPAVIPDAQPMEGYFGFDDQELAETFGEMGDEEIGGHWVELGETGFTDYVLTASEYKRSVRAQILKNSSRCTPPEIIRIVDMMLEGRVRFIYTELDMTIIIAPETPLSSSEISLLRSMIPKPAGVRLAIVNGYHDDFGFKGQHMAQPFGETSDPTIGGYWSTLKEDLNNTTQLEV